MLANVNRTKKTDKVYSPEDFMPKSMTDRDPATIDGEQAGRILAERFRAVAEFQKAQGHGQ